MLAPFQRNNDDDDDGFNKLSQTRAMAEMGSRVVVPFWEGEGKGSFLGPSLRDDFSKRIQFEAKLSQSLLIVVCV
jgi:hypothetical protein